MQCAKPLEQRRCHIGNAMRCRRLSDFGSATSRLRGRNRLCGAAHQIHVGVKLAQIDTAHDALKQGSTLGRDTTMLCLKRDVGNC